MATPAQKVNLPPSLGAKKRTFVFCLKTAPHITSNSASPPPPLLIDMAAAAAAAAKGTSNMSFTFYLGWSWERTRGASESVCIPGGARKRASEVSRLPCCRFIFRIEGTAPARARPSVQARCPSSLCSSQQVVHKFVMIELMRAFASGNP